MNKYLGKYSNGLIVLLGFLTTVLPVFLCDIYPQQYDYREFSSGLAQPYVYSIIQDDDGYLWIGTGNGLTRYNGIEFKSFRTSDSLADNFITCSWKNGNDIWFGHMNGEITNYNGKEFSHFITRQNLSGISDIEINPDGTVWAGTFNNGIFKIDRILPDTKVNKVKDCDIVYSLKFINNSEILVGSYNGLFHCVIDESSNVKVIGRINEIPDDKIPAIISINNGTGYYVATENQGIYYLRINNGRYNIAQIADELNITGLQDIYEDSKSNLWVCTFGSGLIKLSKQEANRSFQPDYYNKSTGFLTDNVKTVYEDREGNIWSGNYGTGLTQLVEKTLHNITFDEIRYGSSVESVVADNKYRWLGTKKGLLKTDKLSGQIITFFSTSAGLPEDGVTSLYSSDDHELWIGTGKNGIFRLGKDDSKVRSYRIGNGLLENSITAITGKDDQVWIGTKKGICNINLSADSQVWYSIVRGGLPHNSINHLYLDARNDLWISAQSNILARIKNGRIEKTKLESEKDIISINSVVNENDSTIWVATNGAGVFRISPDTVINLNSSTGLLSDYCYSIVYGSNQFIWIGHRGGLSRIRSTDLLIKTLQNYAGIGSGCLFNLNAVFRENSGNILFGSDRGLWLYNPASDMEQSLPPALNITSVKVNDKAVDYAQKIILPAGKYSIEIEYMGVYLKEPLLVTYQYYLEGFDKHPEKTNSTKVVYNHLNHGKYTFFLNASSGDGVENESPVVVEITIKVPVWKQWWFYVLLFTLAAVLLVIYIKRREFILQQEKRALEAVIKDRTFQLARKNSILREKQLEITKQNTELEKYRNYLENLVEERTKELLVAKNKAEESDRLKTSFLNNISHEIRTPLNAAGGFSKLLNDNNFSNQERRKFVNIINDNIDSLLELMDDIIDISLLEADQISLSFQSIDINDLLREIEEIFRKNNKKQLDIKYKTSDNLSDKIYLNSDMQRIRQIITNLLNNAVKFSEKGQVQFGFDLIEKQIRFFVSDTGIGIDKEDFDKIFNPFYKIESNNDRLYRGAGIGLAICKKIVELMGGEIWVESEIDTGSVFYFTVPVDIEDKDSK
ncbi:MAG: ATP-binding protein, partial [Bacteroidales bacterium]